MKTLSRRGMLSNGMALASLGAFSPALGQPAPATPAGAPGRGGPPQPPFIERFDPALDALIDSNSPIEQIDSNSFQWCEGPVWIGGANGYLLASDPRANQIMQYNPATKTMSVWRKPSGLQDPVDPVIFREPGTNGLFLGRGGIIAADSGTRAIVRIDIATKQRTILADRFEGKRFNSPNDLIVSPTTGIIYFTDPPYGLVNKATPEQRGQYLSPAREMDYMGVFSIAPDNTVKLVGKYQMPNGVGISPDGRTLYNTDGNMGWVAHTLDAQGNSTSERPFIDRVAEKFTNPRAAGDGFKVDSTGHLWISGDGGISIITPQGHRLGRIRIFGSAPNCEFGADGYLYIPNGTGMLRVAVKAKKMPNRFV